MMTRRGFGSFACMAGAGIFPVAATCQRIQAGEDIEPILCINPWQQARKGNAMVRPSEVVKAELVQIKAVVPSTDWLEVQTVDGRVIQTETQNNQPDVYALAAFLEKRGVKVERTIIS